MGTEIVAHWYLVLLLVAMVALLWTCYRMPGTPVRPLGRYYVTQTVTLLLFVPVTIFGMRGNTFFSATRPIAVSYAHRYVSDPIQTGIVLNTPFSIIRTINQLPKETPVYFADRAEMEAIYNPVHQPSDSAVVRRKNIVILIVERQDLYAVGIAAFEKPFLRASGTATGERDKACPNRRGSCR